MQDNNSNQPTEEQDLQAANIDRLSQEILASLKEGDFNVDVEPLMNAIQAYAANPKYYGPAVQRWKERLKEITEILHTHYNHMQEELKNLMDNDPKIAAYNKTKNIKE